MNEGTLFSVVPLTWCPHLESVRQDSDLQWGVQSPCRTCEDRSENWICLSCDEVCFIFVQYAIYYIERFFCLRIKGILRSICEWSYD